MSIEVDIGAIAAGNVVLSFIEGGHVEAGVEVLE